MVVRALQPENTFLSMDVRPEKNCNSSKEVIVLLLLNMDFDMDVTAAASLVLRLPSLSWSQFATHSANTSSSMKLMLSLYDFTVPN